MSVSRRAIALSACISLGLSLCLAGCGSEKKKKKHSDDDSSSSGSSSSSADKKAEAVLPKLDTYKAPPLPSGTLPEPWDARKMLNDPKLPNPPTLTDTLLTDLRLSGIVDVKVGDVLKAPTPEALEKIIAFYVTTSEQKIRGYRGRFHKTFLMSLSEEERKQLAKEAAEHIKAKGIVDPDWKDPPPPAPGAPTPAGAGGSPAVGAAVKAGFNKIQKPLYAGTVKRTYGKLGWVAFRDGSGSWEYLDKMDPPQTPDADPPATDTCEFAIGDKVRAPWSSSRSTLWRGTVDEKYGKLVHVHFNDSDLGWAECHEVKK